MNFEATWKHDVQLALKRTIDREIDGLRALHGALDAALGDALHQTVALINSSKGRVVVTGMGKSGHVARKIAATLASTGTAAHFMHPAEASHGDLGMIREEDVVLAISWSGEAPELSDTVAYTRRFGIRLVAITSRADSALGKNCDIPLILPSMPEACPNGLAPTTSTTMQMAVGDAIAVALLTTKGFTAQDFKQFHPGGRLGARLRKVRDVMHSGKEVPLIVAGDMLSHAIVEMTSKRFGTTAVVDEAGKLIGVVTDGDVRRAFKAQFSDCRVKDMMGRSPRTIGQEALLDEALGIMNATKITSLFVVDDERPVGIIHIHDLLRAGVV